VRVAAEQGDQIGRFFAHWLMANSGQFFYNYRSSPHFWSAFFCGKSGAFILAKMIWATFWTIFSHSHLVALLRKLAKLLAAAAAAACDASSSSPMFCFPLKCGDRNSGACMPIAGYFNSRRTQPKSRQKQKNKQMIFWYYFFLVLEKKFGYFFGTVISNDWQGPESLRARIKLIFLSSRGPIFSRVTLAHKNQ
jgi:hypothetical protein